MGLQRTAWVFLALLPDLGSGDGHTSSSWQKWEAGHANLRITGKWTRWRSEKPLWWPLKEGCPAPWAEKRQKIHPEWSYLQARNRVVWGTETEKEEPWTGHRVKCAHRLCSLGHCHQGQVRMARQYEDLRCSWSHPSFPTTTVFQATDACGACMRKLSSVELNISSWYFGLGPKRSPKASSWECA